MRSFRTEDMGMVNSWYMAHGDQPITLDSLPQTGLIEPGIAAGFLYKTDSNIAWLEGFVTNPEAPPSARNEALDNIANALMVSAKALGFRQVIAMVENPRMMLRADRHGFKGIGAYVMMKKEI